MRFLKGHGTANDFVVLPDPDGRLDLSPDLVAAICARRTGVGADGLLRVVPSTACADAPIGPRWFMDYRNADGSLAEMCGNGARVFARYLIDAGLETGPTITFGTRSGPVTARVGEEIAVSLRRPRQYGHSTAVIGGRELPGTAVSVGNPHLVCVVADVAAVDFASAPGYDRSFFPEGVNVEVVEIDADPPRMRVYERGSGETLSCGTGACAVAAAVLGHRPGSTAVDLPGGRVTVTVTDDRCWLSGPAVLVAEGELQIDRLG